MLLPILANEDTTNPLPDRPVLTGFQELPLFVDKKIPFALVPAKILLPLIKIDLIAKKPTGKPAFMAVQVLPLFVDR